MMTKTIVTDDRTFNDLNGEEQLAVLVLRALEAGRPPNYIRNIVDRVIGLHQAVDAELTDDTGSRPPKAYGHLRSMK